MIKIVTTLKVAALLCYLSLPIHASYIMTTDDVMHTVDPETLLTEYQLFIPVPITLSPLTTEKKDLFVTASYGGLNKKDSRNFFANQKE